MKLVWTSAMETTIGLPRYVSGEDHVNDFEICQGLQAESAPSKAQIWQQYSSLCSFLAVLKIKYNRMSQMLSWEVRWIDHFPAFLPMARIYEFNLRSGLKLRPNRHTENEASYQIDDLYIFCLIWFEGQWWIDQNIAVTRKDKQQ